MKIKNIKFKAKRLDGKGWIEGTPICINGKPYGIMIGEKESPDIDPSTICQFTGEKDMNGDDIYVGDIISNLETKSVIEVVWNDKMKMLDCKFLNGVKCCFDIPFGTFVARYHRIVVLRSKFDKEKQRMNYKKVLTRYIQERLSELSNVDAYEPNKLALTNMLFFLGKVTSNELIVAKLKIMVDADIKRKKYLSRYDGNESLYDDEYSKAVSTIGKKCLSYLRNAKKEVQDENKASQEDLEKPE